MFGLGGLGGSYEPQYDNCANNSMQDVFMSMSASVSAMTSTALQDYVNANSRARECETKPNRRRALLVLVKG